MRARERLQRRYDRRLRTPPTRLTGRQTTDYTHDRLHTSKRLPKPPCPRRPRPFWPSNLAVKLPPARDPSMLRPGSCTSRSAPIPECLDGRPAPKDGHFDHINGP